MAGSTRFWPTWSSSSWSGFRRASRSIRANFAAAAPGARRAVPLVASRARDDGRTLPFGRPGPNGLAAHGGHVRPGLGVLGDFHIIREVGRGGMGVVYEAEQLSLRRRVALKVLPFAAAADPRQLQRFKSEAQATALLHHTNIVPVHAVGAERGVHYYAMQFIDGRTLADVISELRDSRADAEEGDGEGTRVWSSHPATAAAVRRVRPPSLRSSLARAD